MRRKTRREWVEEGAVVEFIPTTDPKAFYEKVAKSYCKETKMSIFKELNKITNVVSENPNLSVLIVTVMEAMMDMRYGGEVKYMVCNAEYMGKATTTFTIHSFPEGEEKYTDEAKDKIAEEVGNRLMETTMEHDEIIGNTALPPLVAMVVEDIAEAFRDLHNLFDKNVKPQGDSDKPLDRLLLIGINGKLCFREISYANKGDSPNDGFSPKVTFH